MALVKRFIAGALGALLLAVAAKAWVAPKPLVSQHLLEPVDRGALIQFLPPAYQQANAEVISALMDFTWEHQGLKNILLAGRDTMLRFEQDGDGVLMKISVTTYPGVSGGTNSPKVSSSTAPVAVHGPVLEWDRQLTSFVLLPGERLILNAVVPLRQNVWYSRRRDFVRGRASMSDDNALRSIDTEYWFDFRDPLKPNASGRVMVHKRIDHEIFGIPASFRLKTVNDHRGTTYEVSITPDVYTRHGDYVDSFILYPGFRYGTMWKQGPFESDIFVAEKKA